MMVMVILPQLAMADSKWVGTGEEFTPDGKSAGNYKIEVVNTDKTANVSSSQTTITRQDGTSQVTQQTITSSGNGWSVDSDFGKGGGTCYGADTCENYIQGQNGFAVATTIIKDDSQNLRDISFLLDNGKAVRIFKDKLTKVQ